jgi:transposase
MAIPQLTVKGYKAEDIKRLLTDNDSFVVATRLYLVYLVALGHSSRKLAEIHDISFKQITTWVHRFEAEGLDGLKNRKGRGRKSLLSKEKKQKIKTVVLKDLPSDHGYKENKWTGPPLAEWIESKYGIKYQRAQIYNLLRSLGIEFYKDEGLVSTKV